MPAVRKIENVIIAYMTQDEIDNIVYSKLVWRANIVICVDDYTPVYDRWYYPGIENEGVSNEYKFMVTRESIELESEEAMKCGDFITGDEYVVQLRQRIRNEEMKKITRFEVIDERGRVYARMNASVDLSIQDEGRTLKVFVKDT